MNGYWKRPRKLGKSLMLGPVQLNWYMGLRIYLTWPWNPARTLWPLREWSNLGSG
jgi:hypothetical protein